ncbi:MULTISPECIES: hypothetical protein [Neisseria]|uniref:Cytochrome C n=1 Tax=Neisseria dumasiana TaxID=1931275 RepID=A0A1X3DLK2_9NEIS|nr:MULTISPECIES: hypothetical protein [Neisseria]KPN74381.1 cytochrome C [Neisseria sp. 74A18]OSI17184.1 cytochrome C [Neisseria dumasiana]OSI25014.1 cytochrome C [Neisseria dumasiana]OSI36285.1 cytochrome C [Neisseria dumasiana]UOO84214.1 cytochrome C [Neisseria dumasiana]
MKLSVFTLAVMASIGLAACSQQVETSVPASSTAASATSAEKQIQTLTGTDGKVSIVIQGSSFENVLQDKNALPEGITAEELTLLQRDSNSDITLYVVNLGAPKTDAKTYFANLKTALESTQGLTEVQAGAATDTRMNYRFAQNDNQGNLLRESCISIYENNLYNVCASSPTASAEALAAVLKEVNLVK